MKQFVYTVHSDHRLHARCAGVIAGIAKRFADTMITISCNGKDASASARMKLMGLNVKHGSRITIMTEGKDEDAAIIALSDFFQNSL